jgi:deaminated glutathione amidase
MYRAAVVQLASQNDVATNLATMKRLIAQAVADGTQLIVLPENFAFMGAKDNELLAIAEVYLAGPIQAFLSAEAKRHGIWLVGGTLPLQTTDETKVTASCLVFDPQGDCVARYDKMHLFDVQVAQGESYCESAVITAGSKPVWVDTPLGRIGLTVCYDLRFPKLYRQLAMQGCELIVCPAAFTQTTGAAHWDVLVRARAIENLCYLLAANQGGAHADKRQTYGHSMLVEPWGEILASCEYNQTVVTGDIDLTRVALLREQFPCLQHERE